MSERRSLLVIFVFWALGFFLCGGCRAPVINYTIQTSSPDIWADQPKQNVAFKMEFRR